MPLAADNHRSGDYMSLDSSRSSQLRNRESVIRGFDRVLITPILSCVMKSTSSQKLYTTHANAK